MDLGTWILLGSVGMLAINRLILQLPGWHQRRALFWSIQVVNLAAACFMIVHGVPELQGLARYANWVIALLFMFHIVQNNTRYTKARREHQAAGEDSERERVKAALAKGEGRGQDPAGD